MLLWTGPLLLACISLCRVSPSTAAGAPRATAMDVHVAFAAECSPYEDWQSIALVYSFRRAGNSGPITRLLTCSPEDLPNYRVQRSRSTV